MALFCLHLIKAFFRQNDVDGLIKSFDKRRHTCLMDIRYDDHDDWVKHEKTTADNNMILGE